MKRTASFFLVALLASSIAVAIAATVQIQEWPLPTPKSLPHDPAVGADGALWYTGMQANVIGRLDLRTGKVLEYPVKTRDSGPHGLVADREGKIWFTANYKGYIGRLDPQNGAITEYPMPDPAARDPHTPVFDDKGLLWFTVQNGNMVGMLDPATGKITLQPVPTANARPYGIAVDPQGTPFFCEFGSHRIGSIDPVTMTVKEYPLPKDARPRRIASTTDGRLYYTDYKRGYLGSLDPKSGLVEEWPSPGGPKAQPYAIAATPDDVIWYSESGVKPNTIVRFDPVTKKFASWPIPSGGGVVRNMVAAPGDTLYIACSGVNKVGVVRVEEK